MLVLKPPDQFMTSNPAYARYLIGNFSYGYPEITDSGKGAKLKIGKFCSFAPGVKILLSGEHQTTSITSYPFDVFWQRNKGPISKGDISIGNDVWIGSNAIILSGVTIGDGAVIGAGSVVTHDIAPYAIVVGNPAKVVKYRFSSSSIEYLLKLRWWDWPFGKIRENWDILLSLDGEKALEELKSSNERTS